MLRARVRRSSLSGGSGKAFTMLGRGLRGDRIWYRGETGGAGVEESITGKQTTGVEASPWGHKASSKDSGRLVEEELE